MNDIIDTEIEAPASDRFDFRINPELAGKRFDQALAESLPQFSR